MPALPTDAIVRIAADELYAAEYEQWAADFEATLLPRESQPEPEPCSNCDGSGKVNAGTWKCPKCRGTGYQAAEFSCKDCRDSSVCSECDGHGCGDDSTDCEQCGGNGICPYCVPTIKPKERGWYKPGHDGNNPQGDMPF